MNIFLIPYTFYRHVAMGLVCGGAGLLAWWLLMALTTWAYAWSPAWDGAIYLGITASFVAGSSLLAEATLRRSPIWRRVVFPLGGAAVAGFGTAFSQLVTAYLVPAVASASWADPTLTSLRVRMLQWVVVGLACAVATIPFRKFKGFFNHIVGGVVAGLAAAAAWYQVGYSQGQFNSDLYLASAVGCVVFGGTFGVFAWGVPDELYAGWLRVVSETRHGRRIPIDTRGGELRERFVGHFPRGLDLFLPASEGVMELHLSVLALKDGVYKARGLSLQPTLVRRFLERVDLRYDARRPTPLETRLSSGDRIVLGPPGNQTTVEFLMLPREEQ